MRTAHIVALTAVTLVACHGPSSTTHTDTDPNAAARKPLADPLEVSSAGAKDPEHPVAASPSASASAGAPATAPVDPKLVREEKKVVVDGVEETWRLAWRATPKPSCTDAQWNTCLCGRLAYGETGDLDLVRSRAGHPDERFDVSRLYADIGEMTIPHWPTAPGDPKTVDLAAIAKRPAVEVMKLGDYDHDGRATEFVLQLSSGSPCGSTPSIVVGISKSVPTLHVFSTADAPKGHLTLAHFDDWEKVRSAKGSVRLVELACGDHGSEEETTLTVTIDAQGLHAKPQTKACAH